MKAGRFHLNLSLISASQQPFHPEWEAMAAQLPPGNMLLVVLPGPAPIRRSVRLVARRLQRRGRSSKIINERRS